MNIKVEAIARSVTEEADDEESDILCAERERREERIGERRREEREREGERREEEREKERVERKERCQNARKQTISQKQETHTRTNKNVFW